MQCRLCLHTCMIYTWQAVRRCSMRYTDLAEMHHMVLGPCYLRLTRSRARLSDIKECFGSKMYPVFQLIVPLQILRAALQPLRLLATNEKVRCVYIRPSRQQCSPWTPASRSPPQERCTTPQGLVHILQVLTCQNLAALMLYMILHLLY